MKKLIFAGVAILVMFCLAERYYRSQNRNPKTPVATSSSKIGDKNSPAPGNVITVNTTATVTLGKKKSR